MFENKKTNKNVRNYLLLTNSPEIYEKLVLWDQKHCFLIKNGIPSKKEWEAIRKRGMKGCTWLVHLKCLEEQIAITEWREAQGLKGTVVSNIVQLPIEGIRGCEKAEGVYDYDTLFEPALSLEEQIGYLELTLDWIDEMMERKGCVLLGNYEGRCGNCHEKLGENDAYCSYCGTKRGKGKFLPYQNVHDVLYGSPLIMKFRCPKCGDTWVDYCFNDERFCKKCGKKVTMVKKFDPGWMWFLHGTREELEEMENRILEEEDDDT